MNYSKTALTLLALSNLLPTVFYIIYLPSVYIIVSFFYLASYRRRPPLFFLFSSFFLSLSVVSFLFLRP